MGRLGRDVYRKKLGGLLGQTLDEGLFATIWAVLQAQGGEASPIGLPVDYPSDRTNVGLGSADYVPPWTLETLVSELLATPKMKGFDPGRTRTVRHDRFLVLRQMWHYLNKLENAEDGIFLEKHDVFFEMGRIAQRQFPWQRGILNLPHIYRNVYLYGTEDAGEYFESQHGLTVSEFVQVGVAMIGWFSNHPVMRQPVDFTQLGLSDAVSATALGKLTIGHHNARRTAALARRIGRHTAYKRSLLREFPAVAFGESGLRLRAPIPELLLARVTSELYMDVVGGGSTIWNAIGKRFEKYCTDFLSAMMTGYVIEPEFEYGPRGKKSRSPDIIVKKDNKVVMICECKAKRMSFEAKFADDPVVEAKAGFAELGKGAFQLWRFLSHARRGRVPGVDIAADCQPILLTADNWLIMARDQRAHVLELADALADEAGEIDPIDRRPIAFCPIEDVEYALAHSDSDKFLATVRAVTEGDKLNWMLSTAIDGPLDIAKPYPFLNRLSAALPWFPTD